MYHLYRGIISYPLEASYPENLRRERRLLMRFTKLGHSCVRLEKDGAVLVIDPGTFSDAAAALNGAAAVLVTHEHLDHLDADAIKTALSANRDLTLWTTPSVTTQFSEFGARVHAVRHGDALEIAGFSVHGYGEKHALIHQDIPLVENTCFMVDGELFHPGDSLTVPEDPVSTLLLPISAPWLKAGEMIDYFRAVAPARGYGIHDAILNDNGLALVTGLMSLAAAPTGAPVARLEPGTSLDL
jgi:L-ascorbate metabolism protein UlaG (beta-lactamase superfamily)